MLDEIFQLNAITDLLGALVPEGTHKKVEIDNVEYTISNKDNKINIEVVEKFNDTDIKEYISQFKENIKLINDCIFLKVTEEFGKSYNTKEFDELLKLDSYTKQDAEKVVKMISKFSDIVNDNLQCEIEKLVELCNKF